MSTQSPLTDHPVLAIDIGGTKMAVGAVDGTGRVLASYRVPTPAVPHADRDVRTRTPAGPSSPSLPESDDAEDFFAAPAGPDGSAQHADAETLYAALLNAIAQLPHPLDAYRAIGVGCGGPMRWPAGEVSPLNIPGWRGFPLRRRLREDFGVEVRLHNDAICLAVAEHWLGAGQGVANMLGMVVSTGVGGGLILADRLIDGARGNAGHVGHVVVDQETPCACGGIGCLEAVASGPRMAAWASAQGWRMGLGPEHRTGKDLTEDAHAGDGIARAAFSRAGMALGVAIASTAALCDLELVTIGGGISQAGALLFEPLQAALTRHARLDFTRELKVLPAELGQDAGLVGAAALILRGGAYWSA